MNNRTNYKGKTRYWLLASLILLAVGTAAILLLARPLINLVSNIDTFSRWILGFGKIGFVIFVIIQVIQVVIFILPGEIVQIAGGYLYGVFWGTLLSVTGITIGSLICFSLARIMGRKAIEDIIGYERVHRFDMFINRPKGEAVFFLIFFVPGLPKDALSYVAGLTPIRFSHFFFIALVARLPGILLSTYWGVNMARKNYGLTIGIAIVAVVLFLVGFFKGETILDFLSHILHKFSKK